MASRMSFALLGAVLALAAGGTGWLVWQGQAGQAQTSGRVGAQSSAALVPAALPPLTKAGVRQALEARLKTVQGQMAGAKAGDLAALLREQDALARAVANPGKVLPDLAASRRILHEALAEYGMTPGGTAADALVAGDLAGAAPLFTDLRAQAETELRRAAKAAFGLGQIALAQGDRVTAAGFLLRAAELDARAPYLREAERVALQTGNTAAALALGQRLLTATLAEHGENSAEHAEALGQIGQTLLVAGRNDDAAKLLAEAVAVGEKSPAATSEAQAQRLNNLAALLRAAGRPADAEPLYRKAVEIDRAAPDGAYADTPLRLANLAELLAATGRGPEAEAMYLAAVRASRQALGPSHPDHAPRLIGYADLLRTTGRGAEAVAIYQEAAASLRTSLGPYHPELLTRLDAVAGALRASGDQAGAEALYREVLDRTAARLGKTHADYGRGLNNLGLLLRDTGRLPEADAALREASTVLTAALGAEHENTKVVAANLKSLSGGTAAAVTDPAAVRPAEAPPAAVPQSDAAVPEAPKP